MLKTKKTLGLDMSKETKTVDYIKAERYSKTHRLHHWVHVGCMLLFLFTGFELVIKMYFVANYSLTSAFHLILGVFIGCWDLIFYVAILIRDKKLLEIFPTPREILDLFIIALCAFRILPDSKYPHYDFYILEEKKYVMKYHPAQKLLALANLVVIFLMGATGITIAEELAPGSTGFLAILTILMAPLTILEINVRLIHYLMFIYFLGTTLVHAYFGLIPQNRQRLRGMVTGEEEIPMRTK
ncbi:MAG: cytochrome b/b6 domain-containing protein [Candidatus Hodarchaeales archaeon]|jgi:cytochrome b subunit of formate dehydrogenase